MDEVVDEVGFEVLRDVRFSSGGSERIPIFVKSSRAKFQVLSLAL